MKKAVDEVTLEALLGSIEKWRKIAYENGIDAGDENCPLCQTFSCGECIINANTPDCMYCNYIYGKWSDHQYNEHDGNHHYQHVQCDECKRLAIAEYKFLKRMLPSGTVK
jgi:hypothetical protein